MSAAFYLDLYQEQGGNDCGDTLTSSSLPPQQSPLTATRKIINAKFPNVLAAEGGDVNTMAHLLLSRLVYQRAHLELTKNVQQLLVAANMEGNTLPLLATRPGQHENVDFLRCGFNLLPQNLTFDNVMQLAIADNYWSYVLVLLKYGAALSKGFSVAEIPNTEKELLEHIYLRQKYGEGTFEINRLLLAVNRPRL